MLGTAVGTSPDRVRAANPITYIRPGMPPIMILHGTNDFVVPAAQSVLLYDALAAANHDATLCLIDGLGHGFLDRNDWDKNQPKMEVRTPKATLSGVASVDMIEAFFRKRVGG
jgi:dipeptidyl aminopeptidase/acylaminoacyl peptidase